MQDGVKEQVKTIRYGSADPQHQLDISNEGPIKPERSLSVNTGVHINASPDTKADLGIYYHNVSQLIETEPVAQFINGAMCSAILISIKSG
ncbi:MAG: hypothetical protein IPO25_18880 [Saprospiraceae bacterium]|nr:hypothetical protein [Saprospiraceae bacterium]